MLKKRKKKERDAIPLFLCPTGWVGKKKLGRWLALFFLVKMAVDKGEGRKKGEECDEKRYKNSKTRKELWEGEN